MIDQETLDTIVDYIEQYIGDIQADVEQQYTDKEEVESIMRDEAWNLAVQAAKKFTSLEGGAIDFYCERAVAKVGYPREAIHSTWKKSIQGRQKSPLAGALKKLGYDSVAMAIRELGLEDENPSDVENAIIGKALGSDAFLRPRRRAAESLVNKAIQHAQSVIESGN